jgi:hypothetical protein
LSHTNKLQKFDTHNSSSELVAGTNTFHRDVCRYMERTQKDTSKKAMACYGLEMT